MTARAAGTPLLVLALALVAGCGETVLKDPTGPFATPLPTPPVRVINRACAGNTSPAPGDLSFIRTQIIRQGTQLQRVQDDLSGAVPGGNLQLDSGLAKQNATDLAVGIPSSTLCQPLRDNLAKLAAALAQADGAMAAAAQAGGDTAAALVTAQAAYQNLSSSVTIAGG